MNRLRSRLIGISSALFALAALGTSTPRASAQGTGLPGTGGKPIGAKPFIGNQPLPKEVTRKALRNPGRASSSPQTIDLTANTPLVIDSAPFWSKDEQFVFFHSNRADLQGTIAGTLFHAYRMRPDGSALQALTGPLASPVIGSNASQTEPAVSSSGSRVVYIEQAASGAVDLIELDIVNRTSHSILASSSTFKFTGLNHPEYAAAIGGNIGVIFAGQVGIGQPYHVYTVDTQSGNVVQLTFGVSDDKNPTLSPDSGKPLIAFDSNRANSAGSATKPTRDVWVTSTNPTVSNAKRVTNFSPGGSATGNVQPAWSTDKVDQPTGTQQFINGKQLIAFASTRYDTARDGNANAVNPNGTHDIYWLKVTIDIDVDNPAGYTITTPEGPTNAAFKLVTSDTNSIYDDLHPTWPQFVNTYKVAYQSDRSSYNAGNNTSGPAGQPNDIFASSLIDINAPTLVRYDESTGEILHVEPRLAAPGQTVNISVKLADLETGVRNAFLQIKNPNSKYQSADGKEHKVFRPFSPGLAGGNFATQVQYEYDAQRIFIGDDANDSRVNSYANPTYISSIDDFYAYSGSVSPPEVGWLPLKFVSRDANTGVATYTAQWKTDVYPSDYVIDVIAYDNAVNPFSTGNFDKSVNWKFYDNVWGFSTQGFQASKNILFVSDYSAGQKFFSSRFGFTSLVNVSYTFWGTESWMTDIDTALLPTRYVNGTTVGRLVNVLNALNVKAYGARDISDPFTSLSYDPLDDDGTTRDGANVPPTGTYDMWRVICRGPVPDSVLSAYGPSSDVQPADSVANETAPRSIRVYPRCVIWNSPYAGSVFTGPGSITDLQVQIQLQSFVSSGGRLLVNGQDVAWALTLGGTTTNSFLTGTLKANFVFDAPGDPLTRFPLSGFFPTLVAYTGAYALGVNVGFNPITQDPWLIQGTYFGNAGGHSYAGPPFGSGRDDRISNEANFIVGGNDAANPRQMASLGVQYPDVVSIAATPGVVTDFTYGTGGVAALHHADASTGGRIVFTPMGLEALVPDSFAPPNTQNILALKNRRTEFLHNAVCWFRTGIISGIVINLETGVGLANTLVRLSNKATTAGVPIAAYTGITGTDGGYRISGVEPGDYEVSAVLPGFSIQKRTFVTVHGGFRADLSFRMTKAEPAVIRGKVTRMDGVTPISGATITAKDFFTPTVTFTATSDGNGNYSFDRVPSLSKYILTCKAVGFGDSVPLSILVEDTTDPSGKKLLQPAKIYDNNDFKMKAEPGVIHGLVAVKNPDGSQGAAIPNATVTATLGTVIVTAITDGGGNYSFDVANTPPNGVDPGLVNLVATAPGYQPNDPLVVVVNAGQTTNAPTILLSAVPPGSLSGLITRTSDGAGVPGVLVQLKDGTGNTIISGTTGPVQTTASGYRYNYLLANVPTGVTYTVVPTKAGFTAVPLSKTATVTTGTETQNVNFQMAPLHTFSATVSLISSPYDYASYPLTNDATGFGGLLDIPESDAVSGAFKFATWDNGQYAFYPSFVASRLRIGRGYFMGYTKPIALSIEGITANTSVPFEINLNTGWNMIGNPFLADMDWTKISVRSGGLTVPYTTAVANGWLASGVFGYQSGTYVLTYRIVPWFGYWVRAYRSVTLLIDYTTGQYGRAATVAPLGRQVLGGKQGWAMNLRTQAGSLVDDTVFIGTAANETDGFSGGKLEKPPIYGDRYVYSGIEHADWGDKSGIYSADIRSSTATDKTWEVVVRTSEMNAPMNLTWPTAATLPRALSVTMVDVATGQTRDIRNSNGYSWNSGTETAPRRFRFIAGTTAVNSMLRITGATATMNGRGPGNASATVNYQLSASALVEMRIASLTGQTVKKLTSRATRAAGINQSVWDLRSDSGISVPSGSYTIEIVARTEDGKSSIRQIVNLLVTR